MQAAAVCSMGAAIKSLIQRILFGRLTLIGERGINRTNHEHGIGAVTAGAPATLSRLRQDVAKLEGHPTALDPGARRLALGIGPIDARLQGGLVAASLHEVAPDAMADCGAAVGFTLALAAQAAAVGGGAVARDTLWIQTGFAALEAGDLYGRGCELFGLPLRRLLILQVAHPLDALWAMEEALKSHALASVIAELPKDGARADLTATRRLTLAARGSGSFGFLLRHRPSPLTSSAETRWEIAAAPGRTDRFGGLGRTAFAVSLVKNRCGPTGRWTLAWDHHERAFSALSLGVAQAAVDRPDRTPLGRTG
jgi:protein ImuA